MCFVFAGGVSAYRQEGNLHFLPFESDFFHPDLVHAADLVVGKAGYSMIAEVWAAGVPFCLCLARGLSGVLCLGCISAVTHFLTRLYGQRTGFRCLGRRPAQSSQIPSLSTPRPNGAEPTAKLITKACLH